MRKGEGEPKYKVTKGLAVIPVNPMGRAGSAPPRLGGQSLAVGGTKVRVREVYLAFFKHDGIPTTDGRCYICGVKGHGTNQCSAPGGGADPKRDEHWTAYRQRRDKAQNEHGK